MMLTLITCLEVDSILFLHYKIAFAHCPPFYTVLLRKITIYNPHFWNGNSQFLRDTREYFLYVYTFIKLWIFCDCEQEVTRKRSYYLSGRR